MSSLMRLKSFKLSRRMNGMQMTKYRSCKGFARPVGGVADALDCKPSYPGSIPGPASKHNVIPNFTRRLRFACAP
jgi:hypothetical protein